MTRRQADPLAIHRRATVALTTAASALIVFLLAVSAMGCSTSTAYVAADRATFDVVEPAHRRYVDGDQDLTDEEMARRHALFDAWEARLVEAEK